MAFVSRSAGRLGRRAAVVAVAGGCLAGAWPATADIGTLERQQNFAPGDVHTVTFPLCPAGGPQSQCVVRYSPGNLVIDPGDSVDFVGSPDSTVNTFESHPLRPSPTAPGAPPSPIQSVSRGETTMGVPAFVFPDAGAFSYFCAIHGPQGMVGVIRVGDALPTAALAAGPATVPTGHPVTLDASGSTDPDALNLENQFAFDLDGDGTFETTPSTAPTVQHQFAAPGLFTVGVQVTDALGNQDAATAQVTVVPNQAPTASLAASTPSTPTGRLVTFDASGSADPDALAGDELRYAFDVDGDGAFDAPTTSPTATTLYSTPGTVTARVRVTDASGAAVDASAPVVVAENRPPDVKLASSATAVAAGRTISFDASASLDPDAAAGDRLRFVWDLDGDGTFETPTGSSPVASRTFPTARAVTVTVKATDASGATGTAALSLQAAGRFTVPSGPPTPMPALGGLGATTVVVSGNRRPARSAVLRGGLRLTLAAPGTLRVRADLLLRVGKRQVLIGRARVTFPRAGRRALVVRLAPAGRRALAAATRATTLTLRLQLTAGRRVRTVSSTIVVRPS